MWPEAFAALPERSGTGAPFATLCWQSLPFSCVLGLQLYLLHRCGSPARSFLVLFLRVLHHFTMGERRDCVVRKGLPKQLFTKAEKGDVDTIVLIRVRYH